MKSLKCNCNCERTTRPPVVTCHNAADMNGCQSDYLHWSQWWQYQPRYPQQLRHQMCSMHQQNSSASTRDKDTHKKRETEKTEQGRKRAWMAERWQHQQIWFDIRDWSLRSHLRGSQWKLSSLKLWLYVCAHCVIYSGRMTGKKLTSANLFRTLTHLNLTLFTDWIYVATKSL